MRDNGGSETLYASNPPNIKTPKTIKISTTITITIPTKITPIISKIKAIIIIITKLKKRSNFNGTIKNSHFYALVTIGTKTERPQNPYKLYMNREEMYHDLQDFSSICNLSVTIYPI